MNYSCTHIADIIADDCQLNQPELNIQKLAIDSRNIIDGKHTLFFCLSGQKRDGHDYIEDAYSKGVRTFVITKKYIEYKEDANYILVDNTLASLQKLAKVHRLSQDNLTVVGITGSNGKTIIKEWLFQLLYPEKRVMRSPKSFNSKIGVPLSLWEIHRYHQVAIIEAGISEKDEMEIMESIIRPDLGIFTNIGDAHASGFQSQEEKIKEKTLLFINCKKVIVNSSDEKIIQVVGDSLPLLTWGKKDVDYVKIIKHDRTTLVVKWEEKEWSFKIKSNNHYFLENILHAITAAFYLGITPEVISNKIGLLADLDMRLEHIQGKNNSLIINDAYIADLASLHLAISHLSEQNYSRKTLIISDFDEVSDKDFLYAAIEDEISKIKLDRLITIGVESEIINADCNRHHYRTTDDLRSDIFAFDWEGHAILLKGSRKYALDILVPKLEKSSHSALLEINLSALHHNITLVKSILPAGCNIIPVIKASAYGAGIEKLVQEIEKHDPSYLAVAYTDEGIQIRKQGIKCPIIILNPDEDKLDQLIEYDLQPEIHSISLLKNFIRLGGPPQEEKVFHLKLDTGMHRLGFRKEELKELISFLKEQKGYKIETIFSHLSSSDDPSNDIFTHQQGALFGKMYDEVTEALEINPPKHILNSEGIWRFPEYSFDYVRLGVGLYGISDVQHSFKKVHKLTAKVISIESYHKGDAIGYGRSEILESEMKIAVINMGYADGLMRNASNGKASVYYNNIPLPIVGRVCMDLTMINVSSADGIEVGDMVEIFGNQQRIEDLSRSLGTIPYEILSRLSQRIVRKYVID